MRNDGREAESSPTARRRVPRSGNVQAPSIRRHRSRPLSSVVRDALIAVESRCRVRQPVRTISLRVRLGSRNTGPEGVEYPARPAGGSHEGKPRMAAFEAALRPCHLHWRSVSDVVPISEMEKSAQDWPDPPSPAAPDNRQFRGSSPPVAPILRLTPSKVMHQEQPVTATTSAGGPDWQLFGLTAQSGPTHPSYHSAESKQPTGPAHPRGEPLVGWRRY